MNILVQAALKKNNYTYEFALLCDSSYLGEEMTGCIGKNAPIL